MGLEGRRRPQGPYLEQHQLWLRPPGTCTPSLLIQRPDTPPSLKTDKRRRRPKARQARYRVEPLPRMSPCRPGILLRKVPGAFFVQAHPLRRRGEHNSRSVRRVFENASNRRSIRFSADSRARVTTIPPSCGRFNFSRASFRRKG